MQHVSASAIVPATAAGRRDFALRLYASACAAPEVHNWRAVADALHAAMPAARKAPAAVLAHPGAPDAVPGWWSDYAPNAKFRVESCTVLFADGREVRVSILSNPGKPLNIGRGIRAACGFYRSKVHNHVGAPVPLAGTTLHGPQAIIAVPTIAHVETETGETFDAATCSRMSAAWRAGNYVEADARAAADAGGPTMREAFVKAWRDAYLAAETAHRDAHKARMAAADVLAPAVRVAQWHKARAEADASAIARGKLPADYSRPEAELAAWCEAVADCYGAPAAWSVASTDPADGEAPAAPAPAAPPVAPAPAPAVIIVAEEPAPAVSQAAAEAPIVIVAEVALPPVDAASTPPVEEIADAPPVEAIGDAWEPSAASHPFIVRCGSMAARDKLHRAVMDGTFPAEPCDIAEARGGCWRVSAEDAAVARRIARCTVHHVPGAA